MKSIAFTRSPDMANKLTVMPKTWRLHKPFKISRDVHHFSETVICELDDGAAKGRGEAAGVSYKGETIASIQAQIEAARAAIEAGVDRQALYDLLPPGGARNAIDCALWDLEAKRAGKTIWELLDRQPHPVTTVYTVGIAEADMMRDDAAAHSDYPVLKVKVGIGDPLEQIAAIREGAPNSGIIIDANQAWGLDELDQYAAPLKELGVEMIEQPLDAGNDEGLEGFECPLPLAADESCDTAADVERLARRYDILNIKLDKTGGLTEALKLAEAGLAAGMDLMVGNMLGSSLAMAPSFVIAQDCKYVDIDGPLLQAEDCEHPMHYESGRVDVFSPELWG